MARQPSSAMQIVKRDEKETKLKKFILGEIAAGRVMLSGQWSLMALSMQSPVVTALSQVVNELGGGHDLRVRLLLAGCCKHDVGRSFTNVGKVTARASQNARLLDAHEQLVIGATSSWSGDCMRRNPLERDAFEVFGANDETLACWTARSFDRLWGGAKPIVRGANRFSGIGAVVNVDDVIPADGVQPQVLVAATSRN